MHFSKSITACIHIYTNFCRQHLYNTHTLQWIIFRQLVADHQRFISTRNEVFKARIFSKGFYQTIETERGQPALHVEVRDGVVREGGAGEAGDVRESGVGDIWDDVREGGAGEGGVVREVVWVTFGMM